MVLLLLFVGDGLIWGSQVTAELHRFVSTQFDGQEFATYYVCGADLCYRCHLWVKHHTPFKTVLGCPRRKGKGSQRVFR